MPYYSPVGPWTYAVLVCGSWVGELFRGKSGWWLVTDSKHRRFPTLHDAEEGIRWIAQKLEERFDHEDAFDRIAR